MTFDFILTLDSTWSVWMLFGINQLPGTIGLRIIHPALIMTLKPILQIMGWPHIVATIFQAFQYVDEICHGTKKACHSFEGWQALF